MSRCFEDAVKPGLSVNQERLGARHVLAMWLGFSFINAILVFLKLD